MKKRKECSPSRAANTPDEKKSTVDVKKKIKLPSVVRLRRAKGVVVQGCDIYIGRRFTMGGWNMPQSKWANPFTVKECGGSAAVAVSKYEEWIRNQPHLLSELHELEGKVLGCWCKPGPCHGDVLVKLLAEKQGQ